MTLECTSIFLSISQSSPSLQLWSFCLSIVSAVGEKHISPSASCMSTVAEHLLIMLPFPCGRGYWQLIQPQAVLPWGKIDNGKISFTFSSTCKFFLSFLCFNGISHLQISFICGFMLKSALSTFSLTAWRRGWGRFTGFWLFHCLSGGVSTYYQMCS